MEEELLEKLRQLDLPRGKYAVFGSGVMHAHGLRKSNDLDILVTKELFDELKERPEWKFKKLKSGNEGLENGDVEIFYTLGLREFNDHEIINEAEIIDGFYFARLERVLEWKKLMHREKDLVDIETIKNYLSKK